MFSKNLYKIMNAQKISGKELSLSTCISQSTISKFLSGSQEPNFTQILTIAKALDIPPDIFMSVVSIPPDVQPPFINEDCLIRQLYSDENAQLHISLLYAFNKFTMEVPVINDGDIIAVVIIEGGTDSKLGPLHVGDFRILKGADYRGIKVTIQKGTRSIALIMHESLGEPVSSWSRIFYEFLEPK